MKKEVKSAVDFLSNILRTSKYVNEQQVQVFNDNLQDLLSLKYENHWFPAKPCRGSGFRCIRINHNMDPLILQAGKTCGLTESAILSYFPKELTIWVDPLDVSYRIGENGSIGILYELKSAVSNGNQSSSSSSMDNQNSDVKPYSETSCKGQFMSNVSRDMNLKQLAAYVYSWSSMSVIPNSSVSSVHTSPDNDLVLLFKWTSIREQFCFKDIFIC